LSLFCRRPLVYSIATAHERLNISEREWQAMMADFRVSLTSSRCRRRSSSS
jgi:hypothetical protein